jgi:hypothetical protein
MNNHTTIEELLDAFFSLRSVSYQRNIGYLLRELLLLDTFLLLAANVIVKLPAFNPFEHRGMLLSANGVVTSRCNNGSIDVTCKMTA